MDSLYVHQLFLIAGIDKIRMGEDMDKGPKDLQNRDYTASYHLQ